MFKNNNKEVVKPQKIKIVGCKYHDHKAFTGCPVTLVHDNSNKFDDYAIAVVAEGKRVGFVGTEKTVTEGNRRNGCIDNKQLFDMVDNLLHVEAVVTYITETFGYASIKF